MNRRLTFICILLFILCLALFVACQSNDPLATLLQQIEQEHSGVAYTNDTYTLNCSFENDVVAKTKSNVYVKWTVEGSDVITVTSMGEDGNVAVNVPATRYTDIIYILRAILIDENGDEYADANGKCYSAVFPRIAQQNATPPQIAKITLVYNDSKTENSIIETQVNTVIDLPDLSREQYLFDGWFTQQIGGVQWTEDTKVQEDVTLYARWRRIITVRFAINYEGEENPAAQTIASGDIIVLPSVYRYGYQFEGWYSESYNGTFIGFDGASFYVTVDQSEVTLYAQWTKLDEGDYPIENNVIRFYSNGMNDAEKAIVDEAIQKFEAKYPGWTVEHSMVYDNEGYNSLNNRLIREIGTLQNPDLAYCYPEHIATYFPSRKVVDLSKYINSTANISGKYVAQDKDGTWYSTDADVNYTVGYSAEEIADFIPAFWEEGLASKSFGGYQAYGYNDDTMFFLPLRRFTEVMYYNKTVLDSLGLQPAKTWDELWEQCEKIVAKYPGVTPFGYDSEAHWFITMCQQNGWDYTTNEETSAQHYKFYNSNTIGWLHQLQDYYQKGYITTMNTYGTYTRHLFTQGINGVDGGLVYSIGSSSGVSRYNPKDLFVADVTYIPSSETDANLSNVISYGPSLVMLQNYRVSNWTLQEQMTFLFMKELLDAEFQAKFCTDGILPVRYSTYETESYKSIIEANDLLSKVLLLGKEMSLDYFTPPAFVGSEKASDEITRAMLGIFHEEDVEEALLRALKNCGGQI